MTLRNIIPVLAAIFAVGMAGTVRMVGAPMDADMNDQGVKNALKFAVVQHNRQSNDMFLSQVARVVRVQTQVVSGMKYIFTVQMAKTPCAKGGVDQVCAIYEDPEKARPYECTFTVWSRPWLNDIQLLNHTCQ